MAAEAKAVVARVAAMVVERVAVEEADSAEAVAEVETAGARVMEAAAAAVVVRAAA